MSLLDNPRWVGICPACEYVDLRTAEPGGQDDGCRRCTHKINSWEKVTTTERLAILMDAEIMPISVRSTLLEMRKANNRPTR